LGYPFLSRHRVVLDYANEVVWLAPVTENEGEWSGAHDIGLYVQAFWDNAYVVSVAAGSPAAAAGIAFGDMVTAVDGTSIRGMEDAAIAARLRGDAGTEVAIGVRRGMIERVVRVTR